MWRLHKRDSRPGSPSFTQCKGRTNPWNLSILDGVTLHIAQLEISMQTF